MVAASKQEPFFLRFQRDLIHSRKSALSNPAQLLRLLTGQERLHHRFVLVEDKKKIRSEANLKNAVAGPSTRTTMLREQADARRVEKAERNALGSEFWKNASLIERQGSPEATDRVLLDLVLGTGRMMDDVRSVSSLKKVFSLPSLRLEAIVTVLRHLAAAVVSMQCLRLEVSHEGRGVAALAELLVEIEASVVFETQRRDLRARAVKRWLKTCVGKKGQASRRPPTTLECAACQQCVRFDEAVAAHQLLSHDCGTFWTLSLGPVPPAVRASSARELKVLAFRLLVLADLALDEEYEEAFNEESAFAVSAARKLAQDIISEGMDGLDVWSAQLSRKDAELRPPVQFQDPRVPWMADPWQVSLLDAVDARSGALVLAPTSAGKTFAAYYVMEAALRVSNKAAVLCVMPTAPLAAQVEAEVHARFGQKPYPHDGFTLCAALVPGRSPSLMASAQIVVATSECLQEHMDDDALWGRLQWVVCDEIHMHPLSFVKALACRCGRSGVPMLALSATIQKPLRLRERLATSTQSPGFQLVHHDERAVDLHTMHWSAVRNRLSTVHPLLLLGPQDLDSASIPHLTPQEAIRLWDTLDEVVPDVATHLRPKAWFHAFRFGPLMTRLGNKIGVVQLIGEFIGERLISRTEFRKWERCLVASVCDLEGVLAQSLLGKLKDSFGDVSGPPGGLCWTPSPVELLRLLQAMRATDLLPCICFHRSSARVEELALKLAETIDQGERQHTDSCRDDVKQRRAQRRAAHELRVAELRQRLEEARARAAGREAGAEDVSSSDNSDDDGLRDSSAPLADMWGYTGTAEAAVRGVHRAQGRRVEASPEVRAARRALDELLANPPAEEKLEFSQEIVFTARRARHVYSVEVDMLMSYVEEGIAELGLVRGRAWTQAMIAALRHGVSLHFAESGWERINFAVQLLFRMGHVQVLLADESLGCGINLPCRSTVILDSEIQGAALTQMAGRAGRRGLDRWGATVFVHGLETLRRMRAGAGMK